VKRDPFVSILMRSYNEAWALKGTLEALRQQEYTDWELIVTDSGSTDGSHDLLRAAKPTHFLVIEPKDYNPSRVMNHMMRLSRADVAIFLNADATPQGPNWLRPLVEALQDPKVAACFGRQIPRPDCRAVFACDYDRCFGDNRESAHWDHFFSMVSSGLRRDVWSQRGFREDLQYAEDDEYTRWCKARGYEVRYVPGSVAMHSHNYTGTQAFKRAYGDARAMAATWPGGRGDLNFARTVLLGWAQDFKKDLGFCLRQHRLGELPHAAHIRWRQRSGRLEGFQKGWSEYREGKS
jgi:rhamnosyltransferase